MSKPCTNCGVPDCCGNKPVNNRADVGGDLELPPEIVLTCTTPDCAVELGCERTFTVDVDAEWYRCSDSMELSLQGAPEWLRLDTAIINRAGGDMQSVTLDFTIMEDVYNTSVFFAVEASACGRKASIGVNLSIDCDEPEVNISTYPQVAVFPCTGITNGLSSTVTLGFIVETINVSTPISAVGLPGQQTLYGVPIKMVPNNVVVTPAGTGTQETPEVNVVSLAFELQGTPVYNDATDTGETFTVQVNSQTGTELLEIPVRLDRCPAPGFEPQPVGTFEAECTYAYDYSNLGLSLSIVREAGFTGDVTLTLDTPPTGFALLDHPVVIADPANSVAPTLQIAPNAASGTYTLNWKFEATDGSGAGIEKFITQEIVVARRCCDALDFRSSLRTGGFSCNSPNVVSSPIVDKLGDNPDLEIERYFAECAVVNYRPNQDSAVAVKPGGSLSSGFETSGYSAMSWVRFDAVNLGSGTIFYGTRAVWTNDGDVDYGTGSALTSFDPSNPNLLLATNNNNRFLTEGHAFLASILDEGAASPRHFRLSLHSLLNNCNSAANASGLNANTYIKLSTPTAPYWYHVLWVARDGFSVWSGAPQTLLDIYVAEWNVMTGDIRIIKQYIDYTEWNYADTARGFTQKYPQFLTIGQPYYHRGIPALGGDTQNCFLTDQGASSVSGSTSDDYVENGWVTSGSGKMRDLCWFNRPLVLSTLAPPPSQPIFASDPSDQTSPPSGGIINKTSEASGMIAFRDGYTGAMNQVVTPGNLPGGPTNPSDSDLKAYLNYIDQSSKGCPPLGNGVPFPQNMSALNNGCALRLLMDESTGPVIQDYSGQTNGGFGRHATMLPGQNASVLQNTLPWKQGYGHDKPAQFTDGVRVKPSIANGNGYCALKSF